MVLGMAAAGCGGSSPEPVQVRQKKPFEGTTLTVSCADAAFAKEFANRASGWAGRTGGKVAFSPDATAADLAIIPAADLGGFAARGELAALPEEYIQPGHPLQWNMILPAYGRVLSGWGGKFCALPLSGDGYVLAYRADRFADEKHKSGFRAKTGRALAPPATWDDLAEIAAYFHAADGKPSLAPLPADPTKLTTAFYQIAASADRKAVTLAAGTHLGETSLAFQFDLTTGKPKLTGPGFVAAADWLARTKKYRPAAPSDDPVAALAGDAVAAVLSLAELGRLPKDRLTGGVEKRFGVAKMPGSRVAFDDKGKREDVPAGGNYIPYLGTEAKVGVVSAKSKAVAAAWDLLADAASVSAGLSSMGNPALGVGPFRGEQIEEARGQVWLPYGFDAAGTRALADAERHYLSQEVGNPTFVLRLPDHAELTAALAKEVRRAATGEAAPADALKAAADEWEKIAAKSPDFKTWVRAGTGLQ